MELPKPDYTAERKRRKREKQRGQRDFQFVVKALDGGLCQNPRCGASWYWQMRVAAHHIVYLSDGGTNEPENGISLCGVCHSMAHKSRNWTLALLIEIKGEYLAGRRREFRWDAAIESLKQKGFSDET